MKELSMLCQYYQAKVNVPYTWFVCGAFRNEDNLIFERTLDKQAGTLEFFVPDGHEQEFLDIIRYMTTLGYVTHCEKNAS